MKRNIKLRYTLMILLSLFIPVIVGNPEHAFLSWKYLRFDALQGLFYTVILWEGNLFLTSRMKILYPDPDYTVKRLIILALLVTVFTTVISVSGCYTVSPWLFDHPPTAKSVTRILFSTLLLTYFIVATYEGADYFQRYKESLVENERIKKEQIISQFELLKQQISPHFLFNSLNTLISLIPDDPELAVKYTQNLAHVYRYVLQHKEQDWVTLETELKFVQSFYFLNKIRFGEHLNLNVSVDEEQLAKMIAPLSLQILIENALKHNVISGEKPLVIDIREEDGRLVVKNTLQRKNNSEGTRIGLQNIINRYRHLSGKAVQIIDTGDFFTVALPLET